MACRTSQAAEGQSAFLLLPYELRQQILQEALHQNGVFWLQHLRWPALYTGSVFAVCFRLREESLEAFYKVNAFRWSTRTNDLKQPDPCGYPLAFKDRDYPLTPTTPWQYPRLFEHLRHLNIDILLDTQCEDSEPCWLLATRLKYMTHALDFGQRLLTCHVKICDSGKDRGSGGRNDNYKAAVEFLTDFRVRGTVKVEMHLRESMQKYFENLDLAASMKV